MFWGYPLILDYVQVLVNNLGDYLKLAYWKH